MPGMKNRHVDLRSKKPAEGGRDFGIEGAARCHGECHWKVEAECEEAGSLTWWGVPRSAVDQAGL